MTSDSEAQEDEVLALESIYDSQIFVASSDGERTGGQFVAHLDLPAAFSVKVSASQTGYGLFTPATNWNSSRIEQTNWHTFQWLLNTRQMPIHVRCE